MYEPGTSPRVWGEPRLHRAYRRFHRNIPTRVGRTQEPNTTHSRKSEHPHACGENLPWPQKGEAVAGTSPRVWGEHFACWYLVFVPRNIPTRVGRTSLSGRRGRADTEHPHACGENGRSAPQASTLVGTSPRVWGERERRVSLPRSYRNIPTRVGRTPRRSPRAWRSAEHPHACGENSIAISVSFCSVGTSPRVWGELQQLLLVICVSRNIPTRVGRTSSTRVPIRHISEHPHACGENRSMRGTTRAAIGTSPRVWGERCLRLNYATQLRNIPTRVGRTKEANDMNEIKTEHPHACGENSCFAWEFPCSSERIRNCPKQTMMLLYHRIYRTVNCQRSISNVLQISYQNSSIALSKTASISVFSKDRRKMPLAKVMRDATSA